MTGDDNSNGFSLLELLAVLVLMAIVAATVMPQFIGKGGTEAQAAARTLAAGLQRARSQAIQYGRTQSLILDVQQREFELSFETRPRKLPAAIELKLFTARSTLETAERGAIRFFPDGGSTGGRITVSGSGHEILVDVDWLTGRVSILKGANTLKQTTGTAPRVADVDMAAGPRTASALSRS